MKLQEFIRPMQPLPVVAISSMVGMVELRQLQEAVSQGLSITDPLSSQELPGFHDLDLAAMLIRQRASGLWIPPGFLL